MFCGNCGARLQSRLDAAATATLAPLLTPQMKRYGIIAGAALLLLFLLLPHEFDNVLDGIVYGSLVGIGFAMTENIVYFGRAYQQGDLLSLTSSFYARAVIGGLGHAASHLRGAQRRIQLRQTALFYKADPEYGERVAQAWSWS